MARWTYKGVFIRQSSRKTRSGLWLSIASFKVAYSAVTLTQHKPSREGRFNSFITEQAAEQATAESAREHIDNAMNNAACTKGSCAEGVTVHEDSRAQENDQRRYSLSGYQFNNHFENHRLIHFRKR